MSNKFTSFAFDASTVAPAAPLEPVPSAWYLLAITDGELKPTSTDGVRMSLEFTIIDGDFKGRKVFDGLNVQNKSAQAQEIAHQQLSAICHATGVIRLTDMQELFNRPFLGKIALEGARAILNGEPVALNTPGATVYEARNTYKGAKAANGGTPVATGSPATPAKTPAAATPPWAAKPPVTPPPAAPAPVPAAAPSPATIPGATKTPAGPKKPGKANPPPAAKKAERKFFVYISDEDMPEKTESEISKMLAQGMPEDTLVNPIDEQGNFSDQAWVDASSLGLTPGPAAAASPAGAPTAPPWARA